MTYTNDKLRIDKWLWAARFFKTCAQAVEVVESGKVTMSEARPKPDKTVGAGDMLVIRLGQYHFEIEVLAQPIIPADRLRRTLNSNVGHQ